MKHPAIAYSIRRSARAQRLKIVVRPDRVELVAPLQMPDTHIHAFAQAQQDWIRQAQQRVNARARHQLPSVAPTVYANGSQIPFLGGQRLLQVQTAAIRRPQLSIIESDTLLLTLPQSSAATQHPDLIRATLTSWLKQQAADQAQQLVDKHAPRFALQPRSIRIKTQKSRWGSCGPHDDINLNWLLILAPLAVFEYVVVHELCHIRHKNHSAAFWDLVRQHLPDYLHQRHWLKQHGQQLMQGL